MIRIGTSGWHYKHWKGPFYPETLAAARFLQYYQDRFDTVEINNSFYKLPNPSTLEDWRDSTPAGFLFAVKASRFITHNKKLKDAQGSFNLFFERVAVLGEKLGPILFQLPPRWGPDPGRLDEFLAGLPRRLRYAFELRNPEWFIPEVEAVLGKRGAAFCMYDIGGRQSPRTVTAGFVYVRLHGPGGPYQGSYSDEALAAWARDFRRWKREGRDVFCYFDNDQGGYAAHDALRLKAMLAKPGTVSSLPASRTGERRAS